MAFLRYIKNKKRSSNNKNAIEMSQEVMSSQKWLLTFHKSNGSISGTKKIGRVLKKSPKKGIHLRKRPRETVRWAYLYSSRLPKWNCQRHCNHQTDGTSSLHRYDSTDMSTKFRSSRRRASGDFGVGIHLWYSQRKHLGSAACSCDSTIDMLQVEQTTWTENNH